jgi:hypothetical protein
VGIFILEKIPLGTGIIEEEDIKVVILIKKKIRLETRIIEEKVEKITEEE